MIDLVWYISALRKKRLNAEPVTQKCSVSCIGSALDGLVTLVCFMIQKNISFRCIYFLTFLKCLQIFFSFGVYSIAFAY